jgi:hypothetical protein
MDAVWWPARRAGPNDAGNSRSVSQLTVYGNSNIIIADPARFQRLCLILIVRPPIGATK